MARRKSTRLAERASANSHEDDESPQGSTSDAHAPPSSAGSEYFSGRLASVKRETDLQPIVESMAIKGAKRRRPSMAKRVFVFDCEPQQEYSTAVRSILDDGAAIQDRLSKRRSSIMTGSLAPRSANDLKPKPLLMDDKIIEEADESAEKSTSHHHLPVPESQPPILLPVQSGNVFDISDSNSQKASSFGFDAPDCSATAPKELIDSHCINNKNKTGKAVGTTRRRNNNNNDHELEERCRLEMLKLQEDLAAADDHELHVSNGPPNEQVPPLFRPVVDEYSNTDLNAESPVVVTSSTEVVPDTKSTSGSSDGMAAPPSSTCHNPSISMTSRFALGKSASTSTPIQASRIKSMSSSSARRPSLPIYEDRELDLSAVSGLPCCMPESPTVAVAASPDPAFGPARFNRLPDGITPMRRLTIAFAKTGLRRVSHVSQPPDLIECSEEMDDHNDAESHDQSSDKENDEPPNTDEGDANKTNCTAFSPVFNPTTAAGDSLPYIRRSWNKQRMSAVVQSPIRGPSVQRSDGDLFEDDNESESVNEHPLPSSSSSVARDNDGFKEELVDNEDDSDVFEDPVVNVSNLNMVDRTADKLTAMTLTDNGRSSLPLPIVMMSEEDVTGELIEAVEATPVGPDINTADSTAVQLASVSDSDHGESVTTAAAISSSGEGETAEDVIHKLNDGSTLQRHSPIQMPPQRISLTAGLARRSSGLLPMVLARCQNNQNNIQPTTPMSTISTAPQHPPICSVSSMEPSPAPPSSAAYDGDVSSPNLSNQFEASMTMDGKVHNESSEWEDQTVNSVDASKRANACSRLSFEDPTRSPFYLTGQRQKIREANRESAIPLQELLSVCDQTSPLRWADVYSKNILKTCKKLGEGVYGEVFKIARVKCAAMAVKIIPIEGDFLVNDEPQKTCNEVLPEIVIARAMSDMGNEIDDSAPNFATVHNVYVIKGAYPADLLRAWDDYDRTGRSENDRPDVFGRNQLFVVIEFADAGMDLDSYKIRSANEAFSIISQVVFALGQAERLLQFEHRDLHVGNILIKRTNKKYITYHLNGGPIQMYSHGVAVSIIDFTNSRLYKEGCTLFTDLSVDEALFEGPNTDYQYEIYRLMRQVNGNNWKHYEPHTNVLWVHYLIDKLREPSRYVQPRKILNGKTREILSQLADAFIECASCMDIIGQCDAADTLFDLVLPVQ